MRIHRSEERWMRIASPMAYVLVAINQTRMALPASLYGMLQMLSLIIFAQAPL